jgi:carbohydrate diacid regulator
MLNSSISTLVTEKLGALVAKKIVLIDKSGHYLSSTYSCSKSKVYDVKKDVRCVPVFYGGGIAGYAYIDEPESEIRENTNLIKPLAELLLHQAMISENMISKDQRQDKLIYDLLNSEDIDPELYNAEAGIFSLSLKIPRVVLVLTINGEAGEELASEEITIGDKELTISRIKRGIARGLESFYTRLNRNIIAYFGNNIFVVLKDLGDENTVEDNIVNFKSTLKSIHDILNEELRSNVTLGVGSYHPGILGLRSSYKEAFLASQLGQQLWGVNQVFNIDDFGVVAPLLSGVNEKNLEFSENMLSKLSQEDEVVKTIEVFLDSNMSLTKTSKILKIHRNTLVYRLDKITEVLGLDPREFDDAVQIKLALLFNQFARESEVEVL